MTYNKNIRITKAMVKLFGDAVDDHNPLHFDEAYASTTRFKHPIVHGALLGGLVSGMFVESFGEGTIYVSMSFEFLRPVYVDGQVEIVLTPTQRQKQDKYTRVRIGILDENKQLVVVGLAEIIPGTKDPE